METKDALLHAINEEYVEAVEVLLDHEESIHVDGEPWVRINMYCCCTFLYYVCIIFVLCFVLCLYYWLYYFGTCLYDLLYYFCIIFCTILVHVLYIFCTCFVQMLQTVVERHMC